LARYNHDIDKTIVDELYGNGKNRSCTATHLFNTLTAEMKKISWTTLYNHLTILCEKGIIDKEKTIMENAQIKKRKDNKMPYFLTPATISKIKSHALDLEKLVETDREDPARKEEILLTKREKVLTLLLLQAVYGSSRWVPAKEPKLGNVEVRFRDPKTGKIGRTLAEFFREKEQGVTPMDIVEKRDVSNAGIFSHINFDKYDVIKYYDQLVSEFEPVDLSNMKISKINRDGKGFFIKDHDLRSLIISCSVLVGPVKDRIEETLKLALLKVSRFYDYKYNINNNNNYSYRSSSRGFPFIKSIKRQGKFIQQAFDWYMSSFGDKRFNELVAQARVQAITHIQLDDDKNSATFWKLHSKAVEEQDHYVWSSYEMHNRLYDMIAQTILAAEEYTGLKNTERKLKEKKKKQKYIQGIQKQIEEHDRNVLSIYHCQIKCDKYASKELERERGFKEYYVSIRRRDLPAKYYELRDRIVDLLYPEFLRKEHKRNPKLKEYVDSLPTITIHNERMK